MDRSGDNVPLCTDAYKAPRPMNHINLIHVDHGCSTYFFWCFSVFSRLTLTVQFCLLKTATELHDFVHMVGDEYKLFKPFSKTHLHSLTH